MENLDLLQNIGLDLDEALDLQIEELEDRTQPLASHGGCA